MSLVTDFESDMVSVTLERKASEDAGWHEATYDDPVEIMAIYFPEVGLVRTITGDQTPVTSRVITETELHLGDLLEGSEVVRVRTIIDEGEVIGYAADL